jgi:hypothetical protein
MEETGLPPNEITATHQLAEYEMTQLLIDALRLYISFKKNTDTIELRKSRVNSLYLLKINSHLLRVVT